MKNGLYFEKEVNVKVGTVKQQTEETQFTSRRISRTENTDTKLTSKQKHILRIEKLL